MDGKILNFIQKDADKELDRLGKVLKILKNRESKMQNPLLSDWIDVRNRIRALEYKIKEINERIY